MSMSIFKIALVYQDDPDFAISKDIPDRMPTEKEKEEIRKDFRSFQEVCLEDNDVLSFDEKAPKIIKLEIQGDHIKFCINYCDTPEKIQLVEDALNRWIAPYEPWHIYCDDGSFLTYDNYIAEGLKDGYYCYYENM